MRKTYHYCLSSHDEVICRCEEDFNRNFNCFAEAIIDTESRALAESSLSTHVHRGVQTDSIQKLTRTERFRYTRYFNAKYKRKGSLGEDHWFITEMNGLYHILMGINYILRQGLHHGLTSTPFEYPYCSANVFFKQELGKDIMPSLLMDEKRHLYLSRYAAVPISYRMSSSGLLLREDILDTAYVEELYTMSPRNFLYQMNRKTSEEWVREQEKDESEMPPVTLEVIEAGVPGTDIHSMLRNENGRIELSRMTDIELCGIIDSQIIPEYFKEDASIYSLSKRQRINLANTMWMECKRCSSQKNKISSCFLPLRQRMITEDQIKRCCCVNYEI